MLECLLHVAKWESNFISTQSASHCLTLNLFVPDDVLSLNRGSRTKNNVFNDQNAIWRTQPKSQKNVCMFETWHRQITFTGNKCIQGYQHGYWQQGSNNINIMFHNSYFIAYDIKWTSNHRRCCRWLNLRITQVCFLCLTLCHWFPSKQPPWAQYPPQQAAKITGHNWTSIWLATKHLLSSASG